MVKRDGAGEGRGSGSQILEQQAFLGLVKTHGEMMFVVASLLRGHGLSEPQYNVLRILRGAGDDGLPSGEISKRMLTRVPDITRLVDRLEAEGLVTRERSGGDRRVVLIRISTGGRELLATLDEPVVKLVTEQFDALTRRELRTLLDLLTKVRGDDDSPSP